MRVFVDGFRSGADNMARDEALLSEAVPTVRFYGWRPACVSLGYAQPESDVDSAAVRDLGLDIVRRPTGGGAILHAEDEVTYSVVLPRGVGPADLFASYRFIAGGIVEALRAWGLRGEFLEGHSGRDALCYLREEGVSVGVGGRKISGGAQKRTRTATLQHGTLLVSSDLKRNARIFRLPPERIAARVTSLDDQGLHASRGEVTAALMRGFLRALRPVLDAPDATTKP